MSTDLPNKKIPFNYDQYYERLSQKPCLFCSLNGERDSIENEHYLYEDEEVLVVLDKFPSQLGYSLVFPKIHVEYLHLMDFKDYYHLQEVVHNTTKAVQKATNAERVYVACLGSQLVSPHIHYHIVPLPSNMPLDDQQWNALDKSRGVIKYSNSLFSEIASAIRVEFEKNK